MNILYKSNAFAPAIQKTGLASASVKAGVSVRLGGVDYNYATDTAILMPTLTAGDDLAVWIAPNGDPVAAAPDAPPAHGSFQIGGFHYAPGGNPADHNLGGNMIAQISQYSAWDLKYRPACQNAAGMVKVGNSNFWTDIYFLNSNHHANGTSKNAALIATGENTPERANDYGGYSGSQYGNFIWWNAVEVLAQHGKRLGRYDEHCLAAFGARENEGRGNHPIQTGLNTYNASTWAHDYFFTSKWGVIQATGCVWVWTESLSDWEGAPAADQVNGAHYDVTGGHPGAWNREPARGRGIMQNSDDLTSILFGGKCGYTSDNGGTSGTRAFETVEKLWDNSANIAARGFADHFVQL